jgi:hypothetical protein
VKVRAMTILAAGESPHMLTTVGRTTGLMMGAN